MEKIAEMKDRGLPCIVDGTEYFVRRHAHYDKGDEYGVYSKYGCGTSEKMIGYVTYDYYYGKKYEVGAKGLAKKSDIKKIFDAWEDRLLREIIWEEPGTSFNLSVVHRECG